MVRRARPNMIISVYGVARMEMGGSDMTRGRKKVRLSLASSKVTSGTYLRLRVARQALLICNWPARRTCEEHQCCCCEDPSLML